MCGLVGNLGHYRACFLLSKSYIYIIFSVTTMNKRSHSVKTVKYNSRGNTQELTGQGEGRGKEEKGVTESQSGWTPEERHRSRPNSSDTSPQHQRAAVIRGVPSSCAGQDAAKKCTKYQTYACVACCQDIVHFLPLSIALLTWDSYPCVN